MDVKYIMQHVSMFCFSFEYFPLYADTLNYTQDVLFSRPVVREWVSSVSVC